MVTIKNNNHKGNEGWTKGSKYYFDFVFKIMFQVQINMQSLKI